MVEFELSRSRYPNMFRIAEKYGSTNFSNIDEQNTCPLFWGLVRGSILICSTVILSVLVLGYTSEFLIWSWVSYNYGDFLSYGPGVKIGAGFLLTTIIFSLLWFKHDYIDPRVREYRIRKLQEKTGKEFVELPPGIFESLYRSIRDKTCIYFKIVD